MASGMVREQDRRVQRVAVQRLQGDLAGELRVHAQAHEVAGLGAAGAVLRQVAAGLAHHPHRGDVYGLLEQCTQETIVLQGSHVGIRKKSAGIFSDADTKGTGMAIRFVYRMPWIKGFCIQNRGSERNRCLGEPARQVGYYASLFSKACPRESSA
jgi:hypothetical protein